MSHRMSTIETTDKIVALEDGDITDESEWNSMMAKDGKFANDLQLQTGAKSLAEAASTDANG